MNNKLKSLGYRLINQDTVYIDVGFHQSQDYENLIHQQKQPHMWLFLFVRKEINNFKQTTGFISKDENQRII